MPAHYKMGKAKMTYQDYVKLRSAHMKQQGSTLTGSQRMKQIAAEWSSKGKGIAMMGGGFNHILKEIQKGGEVKNNELEMTGGGAKLNKLKKMAVKFGIPLATATAFMMLGNDKAIDVKSGFDSRNFQPFVDVEMENNTSMMDEDQITGLGLRKKKGKYPHNMVKGNMLKVAKTKKEHDKLSKMGYTHPNMEGEGFFSDIGDSIKDAFSDPLQAIKTTAGLTLSALPFIL